MTGYTYGSVEGISALQEAISAARGPHVQHLAGAAPSFANALETADFGGCPWGEEFFGTPITHTRLWAEQAHRHDLILTTAQALGLVEAMVAAEDLGDEFARQWLGDMADAYGVDWV